MYRFVNYIIHFLNIANNTKYLICTSYHYYIGFYIRNQCRIYDNDYSVNYNEFIQDL